MSQEESSKRISVVVGHSWPKDIKVETKHPQDGSDSRRRTVTGLCWLFSMTFLLYTVFGMYHHDGKMLDQVWNLTYVGIGGILGWALGRGPGQS